tara:strand:+ start:3391 stop:3660 length:270 start_codon:yes stop_codon:yes gene_type:complete
MVRKIKPKQTRSQKETQKDLQQKLNMFDKLPDECLACLSPFDKTDKAMVTTWNVVVRSAENEVRLYCPECWQNALNILQDYAGKDDNRI